jgi:2'-5' RNA ligase
MTKRTFIGIKINPTEELLRRIYYLKKNLSQDNINWIREDHFHLTLRFLGETPLNRLEEVQQLLKRLTSQYSPFEMEVSGIHLFGSKHSPKVIWAGVQPHDLLLEMALKIDVFLTTLGFSSDRQNFVPHLSLARIRKLKDKDHFHQVIEKSPNGFIQNELVESVLFYESVLKPKGAEYQILGEFPLNL